MSAIRPPGPRSLPPEELYRRHRLWLDDTRHLREQQVRLTSLHFLGWLVTQGPDGAVAIEPRPYPPEVQQMLDMLDRHIMARARALGLIESDTPVAVRQQM